MYHRKNIGNVRNSFTTVKEKKILVSKVSTGFESEYGFPEIIYYMETKRALQNFKTNGKASRKL